MNNLLLFQIEGLYNLIEAKENEYLTLINRDGNYNTLKDIETNIEELKTKLRGLEELFLKQTLAKQ